jgi:hypothetical protein
MSDHDTKKARLALVCDYLRSKNDPVGYINDEIGIPEVGRHRCDARVEADWMLNCIEAMEFSQVGEWLADRLIAGYLEKAEQWKSERKIEDRSTLERMCAESRTEHKIRLSLVT